MKRNTFLMLCIFILTLATANAQRLYLIGNSSSAWTTTTVSGFTVVKVDLSNSGTNGTTAVSLTQWLVNRSLATPTFLIDGNAGSTFGSTDQVWIASGTYNTAVAWAVPTSAPSIFGGFAGNETSVSARALTNVWDFSNETIVSGTTVSAITTASNRTFTIDGLSFTGFTTAAALSIKGGTTVQNCKFYGNTIYPIHMFISYTTTATTTIQNSLFRDNTGTSTSISSYGIYTQTGASSAGGMTVDIKNCTFDGNKNNGATTAQQTGAVRLTSAGGTGLIQKVTNCVFINNDCINTNVAGASALSGNAGASGSITVSNCLFYANGSLTANSKPALNLSSNGAECNVWNCTVVNNVSGGAYIADNAGVKVYNTVFWGTDGGPTSGSGYVNCAGTNPTLTNSAYNAITSGTSTACITLPYTNTTGANAPHFVNPATNNWQLATGSSLINNAYATGAPSSDLLNVSRPQAGSFDIGAYEPIAESVDASSLTLNSTSNISILNGGNLTLNANASVNKISVASGGRLSLDDTFSLTTTGIILQNTAAGTASFVDKRTSETPSAIAGTVEQEITETNRNWYVSMPIAGTQASDITLSGSKIVQRNEVESRWDDVPTANVLTPGLGYIAVASATGGNTSWSLAGNLNSGEVEVDVTRLGTSSTGFNLLGNPYPSYLNWEQVLNLNATNASLLQASIWYRTATYNNALSKYDYTFNTYNSTGRISTPTSTSGYIPPMQAFWVRANNAGTVTFTNDMRSHGDGESNLLKAPKLNKQQIIRLQISNQLQPADEAVIYFDENAMNTFDSYDSQKFSSSSSAPEIYTLVGSEKLVINGLNSIAYDQEIKIGISAPNAATLSIRASEINNIDNDVRIVLRDYNDPNNIIEHEMNDGNPYLFGSTTNANNTNRFALVLKSPSATTNLTNAPDDLNIIVFRNANGKIAISCLAEHVGKASFTVHNAVGQYIDNKIMTQTLTVLNNLSASGVYFVGVHVAGKTSTHKLIIN